MDADGRGDAHRDESRKALLAWGRLHEALRAYRAAYREGAASPETATSLAWLEYALGSKSTSVRDRRCGAEERARVGGPLVHPGQASPVGGSIATGDPGVRAVPRDRPATRHRRGCAVVAPLRRARLRACREMGPPRSRRAAYLRPAGQPRHHTAVPVPPGRGARTAATPLWPRRGYRFRHRRPLRMRHGMDLGRPARQSGATVSTRPGALPQRRVAWSIRAGAADRRRIPGRVAAVRAPLDARPFRGDARSGRQAGMARRRFAGQDHPAATGAGGRRHVSIRSLCHAVASQGRNGRPPRSGQLEAHRFVHRRRRPRRDQRGRRAVRLLRLPDEPAAGARNDARRGRRRRSLCPARSLTGRGVAGAVTRFLVQGRRHLGRQSGARARSLSLDRAGATGADFQDARRSILFAADSARREGRGRAEGFLQRRRARSPIARLP